MVIAAITSCTNTSNPSVMVGAGLLAKKAVERGLTIKPYVKTSLAPGSRVVTRVPEEAGLLPALEALKFNVVGYGCTTCIAAGTPVLLANGTARPIEQLPDAGGAVVSLRLRIAGSARRSRPRRSARGSASASRSCCRTVGSWSARRITRSCARTVAGCAPTR